MYPPSFTCIPFYPLVLKIITCKYRYLKYFVFIIGFLVLCWCIYLLPSGPFFGLGHKVFGSISFFLVWVCFQIKIRFLNFRSFFYLFWHSFITILNTITSFLARNLKFKLHRIKLKKYINSKNNFTSDLDNLMINVYF